MSYADEIRALLAIKEAKRAKSIRENIDQAAYGYYGPPPSPGQVPITTPPAAAANIQAMAQTSKKAGWGWAFLLVGTGVFVFWGIPLLQGKGAYKPGMSKPPPGYTPTRNSPGGE